MSDEKRSLWGIDALLSASELIRSGVTHKNWVKTEPIEQEQKVSTSAVERNPQTIDGTSVGDVRRNSAQFIGRPVPSRQIIQPSYTCVRIRFHRTVPSPRSHSNIKERAQQEEDAPISQQNNTNHLPSQKVSQLKQRKRSREERAQIGLVLPKLGGGERLHPRLQTTGVNRSNMLNIASYQKVKVRTRDKDVEMENSKHKTLDKVLSYTRMSYKIFKSSYYPKQQKEATFYARLMCLVNEDTFECEINWADASNITVLMLACSQLDNVQMVRDLLSSGANPFAFDALGRAPLHYAAERGTLEVIKQLVLHAQVPVDIHSPGLKWTPLLAAVVNSRWDSFELLSALAVATKHKPKRKW